MKKTSKPLKSVLGIELESGHMRAVVAQRSWEQIQVKKTKRSSLSLDPLTAEPDLVGQEIRNHLNEAGIHETRCILCLPLRWILNSRLNLPEMDEEDRQGFIELSAEREFPFSPEELSLSTTYGFPCDENFNYTTLAAVPLTYLRSLEAAFKTARLKPVSISIGIPWNETQSEEGCIYLFKKDDGIDFYIIYNNELVAFRWLEDHHHDTDEYDLTTVMREIRVSLHELPAELKQSFHDVYLCGPDSWAEEIKQKLSSMTTRMGLNLTIQNYSQEILSSSGASHGTAMLPLMGTLKRQLLGQYVDLEFIPPKVNRLQQALTRISSRRSLLLGGSIAAAVLITFTAFVYQYWTLTGLRSEWNSIQDQVAEVEVIQDRVKFFRDWYNEEFPSLSAIETLTSAFPEEGTIWARTLEIQNTMNISCSGFARNNQDLLAMLDQLNQDEQIKALQVQQVQGERPIQFSFSLLWMER